MLPSSSAWLASISSMTYKDYFLVFIGDLRAWTICWGLLIFLLISLYGEAISPWIYAVESDFLRVFPYSEILLCVGLKNP